MEVAQKKKLCLTDFPWDDFKTKALVQVEKRNKKKKQRVALHRREQSVFLCEQCEEESMK